MAAAPAYAAGAVNNSSKLISAANTNRDGSTGTRVDLISAGTSGTRVERIEITAAGTTTAGVVRLWIHDGTTAFLWKEQLVTAVTPSTSISVFTATFDFMAQFVVLKTGYKLQASTHNAESFHVHTFAGDV